MGAVWRRFERGPTTPRGTSDRAGAQARLPAPYGPGPLCYTPAPLRTELSLQST